MGDSGVSGYLQLLPRRADTLFSPSLLVRPRAVLCQGGRYVSYSKPYVFGRGAVGLCYGGGRIAEDIHASTLLSPLHEMEGSLEILVVMVRSIVGF